LAIEQVEKYFEADNYQTWLLLVLGMWLEKQRERGSQQRVRTSEHTSSYGSAKY
jgi:hypothetical protein